MAPLPRLERLELVVQHVGRFSPDAGLYHTGPGDCHADRECAALSELLFFQAQHAWVSGDWDRSLAQLEAADALLDQASNAWIGAQVLVELGQVTLARGQQAKGARYLDEARRRLEHPFIEQWIVSVQSEQDLARGDAAAASGRLEPLLKEPSILTDYLLILMGWATLERDPEQAAAFVEQGLTLARSA